MAEKRLWNDGWEFCELPFAETSMEIPVQGDCRKVDLPHDYMIYDTTALYRTSVGWYRKCFAVPADAFTASAAHEENRVLSGEWLLDFDGVYMDSTVYVNGQKAMEWKYGYSAFEVDITSFLKPGENRVDVRTVYEEPNSRWYSGAGIYRNVFLKKRQKDHFVTDGIYLTPIKEADGIWKVFGDIELSLQEDLTAFSVRQYLLDNEGNVLAETWAAVNDEDGAAETGVAETGAALLHTTLELQASPALWDIYEGNLYVVVTELYRGEELIEQEKERIGFRTLVYDPDHGLLLNGRKIRLNGACEHHDFGGLGAAYRQAAARRKLQKLKEMGINAIRTSHNMPAREFMDLADEMGFLVLSEAFDMWEMPMTAKDYSRFFLQWYKKDVASWIRRDRNHASVLMWSIGNEIPDTMHERGTEVTKLLTDEVRKHDYRKHAGVTIGSNYMKWQHPKEGAEYLDCIGYNYAEFLYEEHHREHPDWVIYGSETASLLTSRGVYHFPLETAILTDEDEQCSALGNSITGWGAKSCTACIGDDRDTEFSMGQFIWTGFDYFGESTPYDTRNSYFGQLDTAGFPKDGYYIFQAEWTDAKEKPMVHLFPYWDFNEGQEIDLQAVSNGAAVEVFVNGRSLGRHEIDHQHGRDQVAVYKTVYEPGEIMAVAYDEKGEEIARQVRHSFGDPARILAAPEKETLLADGEDLLFVDISVEDEKGYPVENAKNRMKVEVTGAGRLLALDNGDSADFDACRGISRRLFSGKLLAVIGSKKEPGTVTIRITSEGLPEKVLTAEAVQAPVKEGISCLEENRAYPLLGAGSGKKELVAGKREIPVRKIELSAEQMLLTREQPETFVSAKKYPHAATWKELEYVAVSSTGIPVNFIELTPEDGGVRVKARGDGGFQLKCYARNGGSAVSVQSQLSMKAEGLGRAFMDPYENVTAGLCEYCSETAGTGIEHGINFYGDSDGKRSCVIGFTGLFFGEEGADSINLSIFANTNDAVTFAIWEGKPEEEGSILLTDCYYHKPPTWMVFKDQSYPLAKTVRGNAPIYIATADSFQLRHICFGRREKAYALLQAAECDKIYGDAYQIKDGRVEEIGNNVTLIFENMDFGDKGADRAVLCYRTDLSMNPVQIRFASEGGSSVQILEAAGQKEYGEVIFEIEELKGRGEVNLIFLPGSRFDLESIRFLRKEESQEK